MSKFARILHYAISDGVPRCSLNVALVVGSILNVINQGDGLLGSADINWPKLMLTICVPYGVSTYSAVASRLRHERKGTT